MNGVVFAYKDSVKDAVQVDQFNQQKWAISTAGETRRLKKA